METDKLTNDRVFPTHKLPAQLKQPFVLNIMIVQIINEIELEYLN